MSPLLHYVTHFEARVTGAAAIACLRAIAARLIEREDVDAAWFAAALQEYTTGARFGSTLDDAFGVRPGRGETPWWEAEALAQRTALLRAIRGRHFPTLTARRAAEKIAAAATRYEAARWRRHRAYTTPPADILGTLTADLFTLLRLGPAPGVSTVRAALANERARFIGHPPASNACNDTQDSSNNGNSAEADDETTPRPDDHRPAAA
ncbi:MAG TPA: hypothetical protein VHB68_09465 [Steroidobacteraceae bacterium]|nr:hypothetical protein [Steroidobacteraceae bacterium]